MMAAQETVNEASLSIKMEDKRLEEDIQSIMGVIQINLVGKEMMIDQWEISDTQRENLREFVKGARSTYEKLKKNAVKVLSMLDEAMRELDEAMVQQEEVQRIKLENSEQQKGLQSKQEDIKRIRAKISKDTKELESLEEDMQRIKAIISKKRRRSKVYEGIFRVKKKTCRG